MGAPKLVVNRIRPNMVKSGDMLDIEDILQVLNIDLIGIVPDDELVIKAANSGEPTVMNPDSKAAIAYRNIARRILGDTVPLMLIDQKKGMFTRFKKFFGMG
ncbi:Septum site-determining protein MinD [compost metagenome]